MAIQAKNFKYNTLAISEKAFVEHYELYKSYVQSVNKQSEEQCSDFDRTNANEVNSHLRDYKKSETYAINGVIFHELFFQIMTKERKKPKEKTMALLEQHFGTYDAWFEDFVACGMSARGWCVFGFEQRTRSLKNIMLDAHDEGMLCMMFPLVVMDTYEHTYYMDYGNKKEKYIREFVNNIDWDIVEKLLSKI